MTTEGKEIHKQTQILKDFGKFVNILRGRELKVLICVAFSALLLLLVVNHELIAPITRKRTILKSKTSGSAASDLDFLGASPFQKLYKVNEMFASSAVNYRDIVGTSPFQELHNGNETFVASAYFEPDGQRVRIYLLRKYENHIKIACSFPSDEVWKATDDCSGGEYKEKSWIAISSEYQEFGVCCRLPSSATASRPSNIHIAISTDSGILESSKVTVSIGEGPPTNHNTFDFPHKFAMCVRPLFNSTHSINATYVIEYIEMVRQLGGSLLVFYLAEEPSPSVLRVLLSYLANPGSEGFEVKIVNFERPVKGNLGPCQLQIISYNDCLYRFGRQAKYFHFTDLDEVIVPQESVGYTWHDLVPTLEQHGWDEKYASTCFNAITFLMRFTPVMNLSIFYADQTIVQDVWKPWRKCMGKSGQLRWMWVHSPIEPNESFDGNPVGTVYHYFRCDLFEGSYCVEPKNITTNRVLWRHRLMADAAIIHRTRLLDM